jgi:hypothetical protein
MTGEFSAGAGASAGTLPSARLISGSAISAMVAAIRGVSAGRNLFMRQDRNIDQSRLCLQDPKSVRKIVARRQEKCQPDDRRRKRRNEIARNCAMLNEIAANNDFERNGLSNMHCAFSDRIFVGRN